MIKNKEHAVVTKKSAVINQTRSICFVSETGRVNNPLDDPSVRYRCYHPAEVLMSEGHNCTVTSAEHFYKNPSLWYDIYVFHRPNAARSNFVRVQELLKKSGAVLIADYDDLIFGDKNIALVSSAVVNGTLTEEKAVKAFANNLDGLRSFEKVTASTTPLVEQAQEHNLDAKVLLSPNMIPPSVLSIHKDNGTPFTTRPLSNIGYFAGTRSHDKDFPIVQEVIHRVLCENPAFNFFIVGPVSIPPSLAMLPNVKTRSVVNFLRLPGLMSICSKVIAPLEKSAFNDCKSRVKFLEATLGGCRLISSPIPDMLAIGEEYITFCDNMDGWYEALTEPLDEVTRKSQALRNFEHIENVSYNTSLKLLAEIT